MAKVIRNSIQQYNCILKSFESKYFQFFHTPINENKKEDFLNFSTDDFLGLDEKFKLKSVSSNQEPSKLQAYSSTVQLLQKIFNSEIRIFSNEATFHHFTLRNLVTDSDCILMDQNSNPNLKIAIKSLDNQGIPVFILKNTTAGELEAIISAQKRQNGKIWFAGQSIYPVPGKYAPLQILKTKLEKFSQLHLYLNDSYSLGWYGWSGKGVVCSTFGNMEKVVMVSSLAKGFGAKGGIMVSKNINSQNFAEEILHKDFITDNLTHISHNSEFFLTDRINIIQAQLRSQTSYFYNLIKDHLPCISHTSLPVLFIATYTPKNTYEVCSRLLNRGIYVTSAVYPHSNVNQPGIKINITLKHSRKNLKTLAQALRDVYKNIYKKPLATPT